MPYKSEKVKVVNTKYDRRVKLNSEQKKEIFENKLGLSQRKLASLYGVSRRTIQFILDPSKLERNKQARLERGGWVQYYDKDKHREYIKDHRRYKQGLYIKNEIQIKHEEI